MGKFITMDKQIPIAIKKLYVHDLLSNALCQVKEARLTGYIPHDSIHVTLWKRGKHMEMETGEWVTRFRVKKRLTTKGKAQRKWGGWW